MRLIYCSPLLFSLFVYDDFFLYGVRKEGFNLRTPVNMGFGSFLTLHSDMSFLGGREFNGLELRVTTCLYISLKHTCYSSDTLLRTLWIQKCTEN